MRFIIYRCFYRFFDSAIIKFVILYHAESKRWFEVTYQLPTLCYQNISAYVGRFPDEGSGPGFTLQVLTADRSGSGLFVSIPNANRLLRSAFCNQKSAFSTKLLFYKNTKNSRDNCFYCPAIKHKFPR